MNPFVDLLKPECWFQMVDADKDGKICVKDLSSHLSNCMVICSKDFFKKLEETGKIFKLVQA